MLWVHMSDLAWGRELETEFLIDLLAYVETKTAYEVLSKVLELLYRAHSKGLASDKIVSTFSDWLTQVEEQYRFYAERVDPWFRDAKEKIEKLQNMGATQATEAVTSS